MAKSHATDWVGSTIDNRYAIERVVGEGGQGIVYRGRHLGFDEPIAIKFLKLPLRLSAAQRDELLESFRAEARLLHRLSRKSAGIVQALDIGATSSPSGSWSPYIVMEWLEGQGLDTFQEERLARGEPPLALADAVRLLTPAAEALAIAHKNGISHLDVKPGNLFVCRDGEPALKVLDFGIAKVLGAAPSVTQAARVEGVLRLFTPAYAAPEQFDLRHGPRGPWTDVFALALILLELATGESPLGDGSISQMYAVSRDERRRPSLAAHGVRWSAGPDGSKSFEQVERVLTRALAVDPEARHRDAAELWRELEAILGTRTVASQPLPVHARTTANLPAWSAARDDERSVSTAPTVPAEGGERGENRVCAIVIAGLSGLSELSTRLEPEQVTDITDHLFGFLSDCVESLGGVVDRHIGGALMAVFGLLRASDNDAERAVHAALDMQRTLAGFALPHRALRRFRIGLRVGIATGRVFVRRGRDGRTPSVTGAALTAAARLEAAAEDGQILIERDTCRLVAGLFDLERVATLPGAYRVERVTPPRAVLTVPEFHGIATQFVGRAAELATLTDLFDTVVSEPTARVVTVVGNAGMGKSRLLAELASRIGQRAVMWVAHGSPLAVDHPYGALAGVLRAAFHVHQDDPPEVVDSKLRRGVRELRRGRAGDLYPRPARTTGASEGGRLDTQEIVELLARVLGERSPAEAATSGASSRQPDSMIPDEAGGKMKQRIAVAMATIVRSVGKPVIICCDDAQWIDDATLDLVDDLGVRAADAPFLVLCTARPALYERRPLWGEGKDAHVRVDVGPLSRRHLEQMARDRLQRAGELSDELVRRLAEHADGSPLVLDETIQLLVDAGAIEIRQDEAWTVHAQRLGELALPTTVQGVVQARIDRLGEREREVLVRAAVVGRTFWDGVLLELGVDLEQSGLALSMLRERGLVHARDTSLFPDEQEYVFAESATQHVAYESLSLKVRTRMHRVVASWLEARTGEGAASLRARHHELAGDLAKAARAYAQAGAHAAELGQNTEALHHFERAARIDEDTLASATPSTRQTSPITLETSDTRALSWRERVLLRLSLGDVKRRLAELDDAQRHYDEARERILRDERRAGETLDQAEVRRFDAQVDYRLALLEQLHGSLDEARALVERALERGGSPTERAAMWALSAAIASRQNRLDDCRQASLAGIAVCRRAEGRDGRWRAAVSELLITLGSVFFRRGQHLRAERCYLQAARVVDERADPYQVSRALNNVAATRYLRSDVAGAGRVLARVLELSERAGDRAMTMVALSNLSEIEHRLGRHESARDYATAAVRLGEQLDAGSDLPDVYKNLANAALALEEHDEAIAAASRALACAERQAGRVYLGPVAESVAHVCVSVPASPNQAALRAALEALLGARFDTPELAEVARRCRAVLEGREDALGA